MNNSNQFLGTERIGKLMKQYALPCVISLLVGALYNIVDQIFIANASYLGSYGNAANTVVFPLTVVALAIAVMIGDGCCAFVSISLGKQDCYRENQCGQLRHHNRCQRSSAYRSLSDFLRSDYCHVRRHGESGNFSPLP